MGGGIWRGVVAHNIFPTTRRALFSVHTLQATLIHSFPTWARYVGPRDIGVSPLMIFTHHVIEVLGLFEV